MKLTEKDLLEIERILKITGGKAAQRRLLKWIFYWHGVNEKGIKRMRARFFRKSKKKYAPPYEKLVIAKSLEDWAEQTGDSFNTVRKELNYLAKAGFIWKDIAYFRGRLILHLCLTNDLYPEDDYIVVELPENTKTGTASTTISDPTVQNQAKLPQVGSVPDRKKETKRSFQTDPPDRSFYVQDSTSTNNCTMSSPKQNTHPQEMMLSKWRKLKLMLGEIATDNTIRQFSLLRPRLTPDLRLKIHGHCSGHLKRLLVAKFPGIEFESLEDSEMQMPQTIAG